jgi:short-subunit dehydrogenase
MTVLTGKIVLVVGATGALGSRIAARLAAAGATLVLSSTDEAKLEALDVPGTRVVGDIRMDAAFLLSAATEEHLRLDGVVVAAGVVAFGTAAELEPDTLTELFAVNAVGPIALIAAALPLLAETGDEPFVVTLSGVVAEAPTAGLAAYSASKAALAAFATAAGREARRSGVRLLDARPGHTETGLVDRAIAGTAPAFPNGLDPDAVADRIVAAIVDDERDLPSTAFTP